MANMLQRIIGTTPGAGHIPLWDTNSNFLSNNLLLADTSTATAAGNTVLTVASTYIQTFTGSTTQTCTLPVVSTLVAGFPFKIINLSSGNVSVNSSGGNLVCTVAPNTSLNVVCVSTSGTTAASWFVEYLFNRGGVLSASRLAASGIGMSSNTATTIATLNLTTGNWLCLGVVALTSSTSNQTQSITWCSLTAGTIPDNSIRSGLASGATTQYNNPTAPLIVNAVGSTPVYLSGWSTFSGGSVAGSGYIVGIPI